MGVASSALWIAVIIVSSLSAFYNLVFLRDPKKKVPEGSNIVSPCDGKLVKIIRLDRKNKEILVRKGAWGRIKAYADELKDGYMLIITMSIFNVHYQYSPIDGIVKKTEYHKGKFLNAVFGAENFNALENEKNEIIIGNNKVKVKVYQVAGLIARRILCFPAKNDKVKKGQKIGLIKLGSQIILIMPRLKLEVKERQKVRGAETIIARC